MRKLGKVSRAPRIQNWADLWQHHVTALDAARFGAEIAMPVDAGRVSLQARDGRWRVVAADLGGLIVEFRAFEGDWPLAWRAAPAATAAGGEPVILDVGVEGRDVNAAAIDPKTFELNPADATPMTLEGLRDWVKGRK